MLNLQEFIEKVEEGVDKFEKQGNYSSLDGGCFYIMDSTKYCCVVGHMMPNDKVRRQAESLGDTSIFNVVNYFPNPDSEVPELEDWIEEFIYENGSISGIRLSLLTELQDIHDYSSRTPRDINDCISKMREVITSFKEDNL